MNRLTPVVLSVLFTSQFAEGQAMLSIAQGQGVKISGVYNGFPTAASVGQFTVSAYNPDSSQANIKFAVSLENTPPYCALAYVVSPSSGVTPTVVYVSFNPNNFYLASAGSCSIAFTTVNQTPASVLSASILGPLSPPPTAVVASILGAADFQPTVSPGELVSIFGANLGPNAGSLQYGLAGAYPTTLGAPPLASDPKGNPNTTITFNGIPAPLLYVTPTQVNAVVPYGVTGSNASVVATIDGGSSQPFTVAIKDTNPAVFTATQTGSGQGAILNVSSTFPYTYTPNSAANPAAAGSYIEFFATGFGLWNPPVPDGAINLGATNFKTQPVSVAIGGQPASVYYVGSAPFEPFAVTQLIVLVPKGTASGPQPLVVKVGNNDNAQQKLTVSIQ